MHPNILTSNRPLLRQLALALAGAAVACSALDVRGVIQVEAGTSGFEPGLAVEWRPETYYAILRPEIFVNEDGRIGGGGAVLYDLSSRLKLPVNQAVAFGPRAVVHNSDDSGWEVDGMVTWSLQFDREWKHTVGVIGALGVLRDRREDQETLGATGGAFYSYRF